MFKGDFLNDAKDWFVATSLKQSNSASAEEYLTYAMRVIELEEQVISLFYDDQDTKTQVMKHAK